MRIVSIIIATILLLGTAGLGLLGANRGIKDSKDIKELYEGNKVALTTAASAGEPTAKTIVELGESSGRLRAGAGLLGLTSVLALVLLVLTFLGKPAIKIGCAAVVGAAVLATVVSPQYDLGPLAPASARSLAYVVAVMAIIGAGAAFGAFTFKMRKNSL